MFLGDTVLLWHLERMQSEGLVGKDNAAWAATGGPRRIRKPRWIGGYEIRDETYRWDPVLAGLVRR